jgi:DNA-binding XRE family transcriptional regulator
LTVTTKGDKPSITNTEDSALRHGSLQRQNTSIRQQEVTTVHKGKQKRLEKMGWKVGAADEFLNLTPAESAYVEVKLALSKSLHDTRRRKRVTQVQLAQLIKSSQSRVAKMEAGDPSVSIDLLVRSLLALGISAKSLARSLAP